MEQGQVAGRSELEIDPDQKGSPNGSKGKTGRRRTKAAGKSGRYQRNQMLRSIDHPGTGPTAVSASYEFQGQTLSMIMINDDPWFVAAHVCDVLEYANSRQAVGRLNDDEKGVCLIDTPGGPQRMNVINESGLYRLIFRSEKPEAETFRRWVAREVLPSIRKTGSYSINGACPGEPRLSFSDPGRYVVMVVPGQSPHVLYSRLEALLDDVTENDCRLLALALQSIETWWHKTEHLASIGIETKETFAREWLERAIQDGARIAERLLTAQRLAACRERAESSRAG